LRGELDPLAEEALLKATILVAVGLCASALSVIVLRTPGHTPGHGALLVRLKDMAFPAAAN
jgi:glyoxylase-like metal-dependent hydrolase (beta-lactamase superfamily II)